MTEEEFSQRHSKIPKLFHQKETSARLIVVLESATLDIQKLGKSRDARLQLLNCDDHSHFITKIGKSISDYRPDITHQCLLTLLDSPLNKAGYLQIFIHTQKNVLIEVHPQIRIPRTYPRFAGLMVQLLSKLSVRSSSGQEKLLNVIKNPITDHLPTNCLRIGLSSEGETVKLNDYVKNHIPSSDPVVVFIGAMAHGSDDFEHIDKKISISKYPLSASVTCGKICCAFEELYNVL